MIEVLRWYIDSVNLLVIISILLPFDLTSLMAGENRIDQKELNEVVLPFFSLCHMVVIILWGEKRIYAETYSCLFWLHFCCTCIP